MDRNFDLCLSFEPDAIRQHFDGDPEFEFIERPRGSPVAENAEGE